ncbi:MAG: hypothetical protein ACUVV1_05230 [Fimbriimonadales bacterium]
MESALETLQHAIQHALALGLRRAGGLEPLREALHALHPYTALAPLADAVQTLLETDETGAHLNLLTRLYYTSELLLMHLKAHQMPLLLAAEVLQEPTRRVAAPAHDDPFTQLFRGEASLLQVLPTIYAHLEAWQPDQPLLPLQLALAHYATAPIAIERLRTLGADALETVIKLASSKSPVVRLRACELLLEHDAPRATAALRSALPNAPCALPLLQKLRARPDLHALLLPEGAPPLEQVLPLLTDRRLLQQLLRQREAQIMLLPPNAPVLDALLQTVRKLAHHEADYWQLLARVPHERITQTLLANPAWLRALCYEHFIATLDYRLIPILRSVHAQLWRDQMQQISRRLPDAAFLPDALHTYPELVGRFGEPATITRRTD